jgi:hypothetical protein
VIPPFDDAGDLSPGLYVATWAEFHSRFCFFARPDRRLQLCQQLEQLVEEARAKRSRVRILKNTENANSLA